MQVCMWGAHDAHVELRGKLLEVGLFLLPYFLDSIGWLSTKYSTLTS